MKLRLLRDWLNLLSQQTIDDYCGKKEVRRPVIDSRLVKKGDIFFALPGKKTHGELFLREVAKKGAVAAVVSNNYVGSHFGLELIFVENVEIALKLAAKNFIKHFKGKVIGITGSVGKTTVKYFLYQLLESVCKVFASPLSYNSQVTLPLSILLANGDEDYLLLEMGSSEPGNMKALLDIVIPDVAIITDINEQHALFYEDGIEGICREKANILLHRKTTHHLLPKDSSFFSYLSSVGSHSKKISFSIFDTEADFFYKVLDEKKIVIKTPLGDYEEQISLPYFPAYINYLISVAAFISLGFSLGSLRKKRLVELPSMRFEIINKEKIVVVNDAFNATPKGMLYAFDGLKKIEGRKLFILGQMNELGKYKAEGHEKVLQSALDIANIVFLIGEFWIPFKEKFSHKKSLFFYKKTEEIMSEIRNLVQDGDVILLKGSRVFELERLISHIYLN